MAAHSLPADAAASPGPESADVATLSPAELTALGRAFALAATPGVPLGPNPRVGCVLLDDEGGVIAEGFHRGAGTRHAEVDALSGAGARAAGATAVVSLEPCAHTGRTGPCAQTLIDAGVRRVVYALPDPNPVASGGADLLASAGVIVVGPQDLDPELGVEIADTASHLNRAWLFGLKHSRPMVTWKFAATLDGRSAAADGTSRWITQRPARLDTHRLRAECDVMMVGTATVAIDDPTLTVRDSQDRPLAHQPLRVIVGERELALDSQVFNDDADTWQIRSHDPHAVLAELFALGRRHVFLEGGPQLAAAFLRAGLIDEVVTYLAPKLLGAGVNAVADLGIETIDHALNLELLDVTTVGSGSERNLRLISRPHNSAELWSPTPTDKEL